MTIFKAHVEEEYLTTAEAKELLSAVEEEQAAFEDEEIRYELARSLEHVNRFAVLEAEESRELVEELETMDDVDEAIAIKIADLLPQSRDELRAVYAQERYSLSGEQLDEILDVVARYA